MRTNIDIDDDLMEEALVRTGSKTKKEVVEMALRMLVQVRRQEGLRSLKGILKDEGWGWGWDGDLRESSLRRSPDTREEK